MKVKKIRYYISGYTITITPPGAVGCWRLSITTGRVFHRRGGRFVSKEEALEHAMKFLEDQGA